MLWQHLCWTGFCWHWLGRAGSGSGYSNLHLQLVLLALHCVSVASSCVVSPLTMLGLFQIWYYNAMIWPGFEAFELIWIKITKATFSYEWMAISSTSLYMWNCKTLCKALCLVYRIININSWFFLILILYQQGFVNYKWSQNWTWYWKPSSNCSQFKWESLEGLS